MVVSGRTDYDAYGRAYRTSLPTDQALGTELIFYNYTPTNYATTTFDVLDRPLVQTAFDATTVSYAYGFGQDAFGKTCFKTRVTDPNSIVTDKFTSARGLNTSVTAPLSTITKFVYDPLGTLLKSYDPENHSTAYEYDLLGRLISRDHPDAGTTRYTYDLAGNVLTTQTQNLTNNSQEIQYNYADCRLEHIEYPQNPEMNVYYEYAAPNSGNQSSRLIRQQDASGVQTFEYGNMGELIKNIHTFVVPGGHHYTFETNWDYDSWNRMKKIVYPDGEIVSYYYDNGGKLYSMDGDKSGQQYNYINAVLYNKYGSRSRIDYGNNTYAEYTYDPLNQRLVNLTSFENGGAIMQNIEYSYDNASNITAIQNTSDYVNGSLGGNYSHEYEYDELYRLTTGIGNFESANFGSLGYRQTMEYSASGNILHKTVNASKEIGGGIQNVGYDRYYEYNDRPHTVTETGDYYYKWDANGNQIHRGGPSDRFLCWDEENRLMAVHERGEQPTYSAYIYDAGGERAWKMASDVVAMYINGQGMNYAELVKTLYVNPYMVVSEQEYSKHYYIEGERVCTKIGGGFGPGPNIPFKGELHPLVGDYETMRHELWKMTMRFRECTQGPDIVINEKLEPCYNGSDEDEKLQYFYHPDHLGSSSFITDATGYATQHLQYLPFGETFVDQQNGYDTRYTFSAKEKDDETQYSYFGARYYDSDLSVWLSVDPMAGKYPSMSAYMYCFGNPIRLIDPNGMSPGDPPFSVQYYTSLASGTTNIVEATYVTTGHRKGVDALGVLFMGVVDAIPYGWVATAGYDIYQAAANNDYNGFKEIVATLPLSAGEAICNGASNDEVVGINRKGFGNASVAFSSMKKLISAGFLYQDFMNVLNSPPSEDEQLSKLTFQAMADAGYGYTNPANPGVFTFNNSYNGKLQEAKIASNTIYQGMKHIFRDFNFSESGAATASERFVQAFSAAIIRDSQSYKPNDTTSGF